MKYAADFRSIARNALTGRWGIAVIAGLIASLLGAASGIPEFSLDYNSSGTDLDFGGWDPELVGFIAGAATVLFLVALVFAAIYLILGSAVGVGYAKFNLDLVDRWEEPEIGTMFGYFAFWKTTAVARLLQSVYILLWSLLFIIPGIVAAYSYAMTSYILAENPELTASEAIDMSKEMMEGNRFRLFCLQMSFIGWAFLCIFTFGIGYLWLVPYMQAAQAAFYREVSGTERSTYSVEM